MTTATVILSRTAQWDASITSDANFNVDRYAMVGNRKFHVYNKFNRGPWFVEEVDAQGNQIELLGLRFKLADVRALIAKVAA